MPELTLEDQVIRADAVKRFFADGTIRSIIVERTQTYFVEWLQAATLDERELLWAKARALDDLTDALQAVVDSGDRATHDEVQRARD
jgi:hypothetical protein